VLHVSKKGILVCYTFVCVRFNGVLKFAGTVKIRGFDIFLDVNQERVGTVLVTVAH
jgi:hypothetical protein